MSLISIDYLRLYPGSGEKTCQNIDCCSSCSYGVLNVPACRELLKSNYAYMFVLIAQVCAYSTASVISTRWRDGAEEVSAVSVLHGGSEISELTIN